MNLACVKAEQFRCAEIAGQHIIAGLSVLFSSKKWAEVHPDHLEEVISQYEKPLDRLKKKLVDRPLSLLLSIFWLFLSSGTHRLAALSVAFEGDRIDFGC